MRHESVFQIDETKVQSSRKIKTGTNLETETIM